MANRLRFGIMCHGPFLSRWESVCVESLLALPDAPELSLLVVQKPSAEAPPAKTALGKLKSIGLNRVLFYLYNRRFHRPRAAESVPMGKWADGVPRIECQPVLQGKFSQHFSTEEVAQIREHKLDFVLRFAFNIIRGEVLESARFGVWSFHHDDEEKYRGSPACFWELVNNDPVTGAVLQRLTSRLDGGVVLKKGHFRTEKLSHDRNLDNVLFESAHWPAEVCADIQKGTANYLTAAPSKTTAPVFKAPTNFQMIRFAWRLLLNGLAARVAGWTVRDRWTIGIADAPIERFLEPGFTPKISYISHRKRNAYYADPFGVRRNNESILVVEDYSYEDNRGKFTALRSTGAAFEPTPLNFPNAGHLSYPFLIERNGETFCIPESFEANEISLYRAVEMPLRWEKVKTLVPNFPGVDATVIEHDGYWWMFCTRQDRQPDANLFLFFAKDLTGAWWPHPGSPVKRDVRSSRPGGTPFVHHGKLYRPAQDCSRTYGGRVAINEVVHLSREHYLERVVAHVEPPMGEKFRDGIHTLSSLGAQTILDGKRSIFLREAFTQRFRDRFTARKAA